MEDSKLISIDLKAPFGFLKKPDINEGIYLTYNTLHRPALLGILGAVAGLGGHSQGYIKNLKLPEYYTELEGLKTGVMPLGRNGIFPKTVIAYSNTVGYANDDGTLIVREQTLINPAYRIFLLLECANKLHLEIYDSLKNCLSVFIPYMGKNDFSAWWSKDSFQEYAFSEGKKEGGRNSITTLFKKPESKTVRENREDPLKSAIDFTKPLTNDNFISFERLPEGFDEITSNYRFADYVYTNHILSSSFIEETENLHYINNKSCYVQLN